MIGALIGDMIGTLYIKNKGNREFDFNSLNGVLPYGSNSIEMVSIADAIIHCPHDATNDLLKQKMIEALEKNYKLNPMIDYNEKFINWINSKKQECYGVNENEVAARAISIGYFYDTIEKTMEIAELSASITHSGIEALNGAKAVAGAIYLARTKHSKEEIKLFLAEKFNYELNRTVSFLKLTYSFQEDCDYSIPEAFICALEAESFNGAMQNAVKLSDQNNTIIILCGALAKALYGYPLDLGVEVKTLLRVPVLGVLDYFLAVTNQPDPFFQVNNSIGTAISQYTQNKTNENLNHIFNQIYTSMKRKGHFLAPSEQVKRTVDGKMQIGQRMRTIKDEKGKYWQVVFTNPVTAANGPKSTLLSVDIRTHLTNIEKINNCEGVIINPFTKGLGIRLTKEVIRHILNDDNFIRVKTDPNTLN